LLRTSLSHAGVALLRALADKSGLTSARMADARPR
jgi:hypothetical protein